MVGKKCPKCDGVGKYRHFGECFDCRGSGEMAEVTADGKVLFQEKEYVPYQILPYTNTASKRVDGKVISFYDTNCVYGKEIGAGWNNINDIWFIVLSLKTERKSHCPLWRSIEIKKANSLL